MRKLGIILLVLISPVLALSLWWATQTSSYTHRFRLAVEVDDRGTTRTGASVIDVVTVDYKFGTAETKGVRSFVRGEAVFVDLGEGRNLIATLGFGPNGNDDRIAALSLLAFRRLRPGLTFDQVPGVSGVAPLTGDLIPTLVTFADSNDPKTARVVRPDEFEAVFGPGVRFKRAFIEMVPAGTWPFNALGWPRELAGEPVTRGIEAKLPMLSTQGDWMRSAYSHPSKFTSQYHLFKRS